ncbi:MAG: preprotein translocase subunit YajC [Polyangiales bacterium]
MPLSTSLVPQLFDLLNRGASAIAQVAPAPPPGGTPPAPVVAPTVGTGPAPTPSGGGGGSIAMISQIAMMLAIFGAFYFFILRPQQTKEKELNAKLKKGDRVVTQSGLIGKIFELGEREVKLELAPNMRVDVLRASISAIYDGGDAAKKAELEPAKTDKK